MRRSSASFLSGESIEVAFDGFGDLASDIGAWGGEGWNEPRVGANDIGDDGNFAVAISVAAADANGGDIEFAGEEAGGFGENAFKDNGSDAGRLEGEGSF